MSYTVDHAQFELRRSAKGDNSQLANEMGCGKIRNVVRVCMESTGAAKPMPTIPMDKCLSVVVPAYNEEATIGIILGRLATLPCLKEIIVVDDCSTDRTCQRVAEAGLPYVRLIRQLRNSGKTAAVLRALPEVTGDITVIQDADLEYNPQEIQDIIAPIREGLADVVYGSRFLVRRATRVLYFYHYLANKGLTFLSNLLTNVNLTDIYTCYKAFRTPLIKSMPLTSSRFGMEAEITALVNKTKARIYEVPISYHGRTYEEGKKIRFWDGMAALWYICYFNLIAPHLSTQKEYIGRANAYLNQLWS